MDNGGMEYITVNMSVCIALSLIVGSCATVYPSQCCYGWIRSHAVITRHRDIPS